MMYKSQRHGHFIASLLLLTLFSCLNEKNDNGVIKGQLKNANKKMVYFQKVTDSGEELLDSATTDAEGNFTMQNHAKGLDYYIFRADPANVIFLVLKGGENVEINGDAKNLDRTYTIGGSDDSKLIQELRHFEMNLSDSLNQVYARYSNQDPRQRDSIGRILQLNYSQTMAGFSRKFIQNHSTSIVSLSATKFINQQTSLELLNSLERSLSKEYPHNKYVEDFKSLMNDLRKLPPGSEAPEINLPSPSGQKIALSSLRGKVVLIDFWASWCGPCRRENPNIVQLYNKYKSKGFEIYGVSLDENVNAWKEAMQKDGITWTQVSELKKWDSKVVKAYNVEAIPYSVLIDREGKIVAKGLHSEELDLKLMELLMKTS